ncbi:S-layer homology domain-containing protein [Deinococcus puniceus]|uniref:S-layer protein n=1 Tax=Deinococcus puniceus TaxID=1182568 RepID=A0A172TD94_9DEIO|nr:S-layer homology domain-containing protein [Deinococcus puniceus]ANE45009.1 S-layer protein [Deinococcus puniceus]
MKKSLLVLTAALSFGFAAAQDTAPAAPAQAPTLTDVPAGHWAKDAIDRLVERGIILGYPDGTFRGTQNLTRYEAAVIIARVLDQIRTGEVPVTPAPGGISDEDLTALQNAIQELAADLTALGVRVSDLEENAVNRDDFTRLEARVEELATAEGDAAAITGIQTQIDELTARADEYDTLRADIDDNASSIAALNDLTVLLNQDILNLQDRVSAAEAAQADFVTRTDFDNLSGRVTAVDNRVTGVAGRVTTLENAPKFSVVGGVTGAYGQLAITSGSTNFDVSRLTAGTFASGNLGDGDVTTTDTAGVYSNLSSAARFTFGVRASQLVTADGKVVVNNAAVNFRTENVLNTASPAAVVPVVALNDATLDGTIGGQKFDVRYDTVSNKFKFSDYLFSNNANNDGDVNGVPGRGLVVNIAANDLPLAPKLTVVTGNTANAVLAPNYYGVRASVNPAGLGTVGVSYGQGTRAAFGIDYNVKVGVVGVRGEGVVSIPNTSSSFVAGGANPITAFNNGDKAFYTEVTAALGGVNLAANYRAIDPDFSVAGANAGMSINNTLRYAADQVGFGAAAGTSLGNIALGAYVDSSQPYAGGASTLGFGAKAGVKFGAFEAVGFANRATLANVVVDDSALKIGRAGMDIAGVPFSMTSTVGAQVDHNGAATNALVKGLDITVADAYYYNSGKNDFSVSAKYAATLFGATVTPLLRYNIVTAPGTASDTNTLKYGIQVKTPVFTGVPLQPSLYGNFANRITNPGSGVTVGSGTTTELLGQVGLTLNQFLSASTTASIGYSYYQGFGVVGATPAGLGANIGSANVAFDRKDNRVYGAVGTESAKMDGVYAQVGYSGLTANYGIFRYTTLTPGASQGQTSVGQGFKVNYSFKF